MPDEVRIAAGTNQRTVCGADRVGISASGPFIKRIADGGRPSFRRMLAVLGTHEGQQRRAGRVQTLRDAGVTRSTDE